MANAGVVINEVHFEPADAAEASEFIELLNPDAEAVDISGWKLTSAVDFTFAPGTRIEPDGYLLVAKDPAGFKAEFGGDALGPWAGGLNNSGESIELDDATGNRIDRVDYRAGFPWPTLSAGRGGSMELIHPDLDNDLGSSWRYSKAQSAARTHCCARHRRVGAIGSVAARHRSQ
ncbi:MAG: lamin tail domain-containing protein [Verrucomicrobiales bacterium]